MMQEIMTRRCEAGRLRSFPIFRKRFLYKIKSDGKNKDKPDSGVVQQMDIIKSLMERSDVEGIISATDDDREGQIIADEIINYISPQKPVERILLNEWTAEEVNMRVTEFKAK